MRTTINLPDDLYEVVRDRAARRGISIGDALAELIRRGSRAKRPPKQTGNFPTFRVAPGAKPITLDQTAEAEED